MLAPSVLILEQYSRWVLQAILHVDQQPKKTKVYGSALKLTVVMMMLGFLETEEGDQ